MSVVVATAVMRDELELIRYHRHYSHCLAYGLCRCRQAHDASPATALVAKQSMLRAPLVTASGGGTLAAHLLGGEASTKETAIRGLSFGDTGAAKGRSVFQPCI